MIYESRRKKNGIGDSGQIGKLYEFLVSFMRKISTFQSLLSVYLDLFFQSNLGNTNWSFGSPPKQKSEKQQRHEWGRHVGVGWTGGFSPAILVESRGFRWSFVFPACLARKCCMYSCLLNHRWDSGLKRYHMNPIFLTELGEKSPGSRKKGPLAERPVLETSCLDGARLYPFHSGCIG